MFRHIFLFIIIWLASLAATAQVVVSLKMDTNHIFIGEQVLLKVKVTADANLPIIMPEFPDSILVDGVEVLGHYTEQNQMLNAGRRRSVTEAYRITSFDSTLYYIPPMEVTVGDSVYKSSEGMALKVVSPDVDTTKVDKYFGPKENAAVIYDWNDIKRPVCFWALGMLLILLAIYIYVQIKNNHRILPRIKLHPEAPPHKWAIKQIDKLKTSPPSTPDEAHVYYAGLTDIMRAYIERRYGFKALAMTSAQIVDALRSINDPEMLRDLNSMFEAADLVKYAGLSTIINENDRNLLIAVNYINATKETEADKAKKQKPKEKPEVTRSRQMRTVLVATDWFIGAMGLGLVAWATMIMYDICF